MRAFLKILVVVVVLGSVAGLFLYDRLATPRSEKLASASNVLSSPVSSPEGVALPPYAAGFSVFIGAEAGDSDYPAKAAALLDRLESLHVNSVAIVYSIFQDGWTGSVLRTDQTLTPSDAGLSVFIRAAHARGMSVTLRPTLDETNIRSTDHWRGQIAPTDIKAWFSSYSDLIARYATFAESEGVSTVSIGVEFESMERYTDQWKALIKRIRGVYKGHVTYSYNFQNQDFGFASDLDFIGVDAYYPLDVSTGATVDQIIAAWAPSLTALKKLQDETGKRIILTEVGIRSQTNDFREPFKGHDGEKPSQEDQEHYFSGLCTVISTAQSSSDGARIRATPANDGTVVETLAISALVRITGLPQTVAGKVWQQVMDDATGKSGFALDADLQGRAIFAGSYIWFATIGSLSISPATDDDYPVFGKLAEPIVARCYAERTGVATSS